MLHRFRTLAVFFLLSGIQPLFAADLPEFDASGFTSIFDGETLDGWDGDPTYWSVKDGLMVGTITPETLLKKNSWIVWRGGQVKDFELVVDYRISAKGNSGVGYRLATVKGDPFSVRGPQADIHGQPMFTGICYEENGRRLLAARGQSTWIDDPGKLPRLVAQFGDPEELQSVVNNEDWNRYRLVVKGNDAKHFLNGVVMSEVHDHDETNRMHQGLVGVQVHVGPPMQVEFRSFRLKHLGDAPEGDAPRGKVEYESGTLAEPDHKATFDNLVEFAARITAPRSPAVPSQKTVRVTTRDLAVVRGDLNDIKLHGGTKERSIDGVTWDLIVMDGAVTYRVPDEGTRIVGKRHDVMYDVILKWSDQDSAWKVDSLTAAQPSQEPSR